ncbi:MAG: 50S ribosomal protein L19 [Omnitrophica bacterium GWA2_52_8]|nr:MAG: 50S ribosomal protein L19 [Omnitrophica bacterium GWA2_52_8]
MNEMELVESEILKKKMPEFRVGDTLKIHLKVKEGDKVRTQIFEGVCIRRRGRSVNASFSVVKETHGDIVEKMFPLYSPVVEKVVVVRKGRARRAKLYFMRHQKSKVQAA